ncbi:DEAD-box ATP-dependent RNA helicase 38, partial [Turnera subulata]
MTTTTTTESTSPPPEPKRDEAEDPPPQEAAAAVAGAGDLDVASLSIKDEEEEEAVSESDVNIQAVTTGETPYSSAATFEQLNLTAALLKGLYVEMKFEKPSKIQAITLPMILTPPHKDLVAQAHNGSGKTTCFVLGMLSRVDPHLKRPQALCICPTRELAIQNLHVVGKMGKYTGISSELLVPGIFENDIRNCSPVLAQVVIGTPGTVKKWMSFKKLSVTDIRVLVFDEADQMLDK